MIDEKWLNWSKKELEDLQEVFSELNMYSELNPASDEIELPILTVALHELENDVLTANLTFSPFEKETIEATKLLHAGVEFTDQIDDDDLDKVMKIITKINNYLPIGTFNIMENTLSYKLVCPISIDMKSCNSSTIETFSLFSIFAIQFNQTFNKFNSGEITIDELEEYFQP